MSLLLKSQWLVGCFRFAHASSPRAGIVSGYFSPPPSSQWSGHGPYHSEKRVIDAPKLSGLPEDPNYRGPDHRGKAVMKRHWITEWGTPQTEVSWQITWTRVNPKCKLGAFRLDPPQLQAIRLECMNTMWHRVVLVVDTRVAETYTLSIFNLTSKKVAEMLVSVPNCTMSLFGLPEYEYSLLKTSENLHINITSVCLSY
jgi:hypothetical protein